MQSHRSSLHVHVIATACVFSLTTQDLAEAMPVGLLGAAVAQLLHAMKTFPNHQQVRHRGAAASRCCSPVGSICFSSYSATFRRLSRTEFPLLIAACVFPGAEELSAGAL